MSWQDYLIPDLTWQSIMPELVILLFALMAPIMGIFDSDRKGMQQFGLVGIGGAFFLTLGSVLNWRLDLPGTNVDFTLRYIGSDLKDAYAITEASQIFKLIFLGVSFIALLGMGRPFKGRVEEDIGEFIGLVLFATLGMMIVASSTELITLFIGIETASLSSYMLAAFRRDEKGSEAGLKYFIIGAVSSGMTLFAISLLYGIAGTTRLTGIAEVLQGGEYTAITLMAVALLLAGLGFKISSVPFHTWAPDVYCGASPVVAGMLATASKTMGFVAIFNIFLVGLMGVKGDWELAVAGIAVVTMTVGNLVALRQDSVRRMLAYSSIAQAGYLLIAVAVGTWYAVGGGIFHLMVNAAMKLGAFIVVGVLIYLGVPDHVKGYRGLGRRAPFLAFAFTIFMLSMAGLPPFGGFASKFVLFSSAIDVGVTQHLGWLIWLAVFAVLNSAVSLFYYLRVVRQIYVSEEPGTRLSIEPRVTMAVAACLAAVLVMGFYPQWFIEASMSAARGLLGSP